jgi:hypothetical protein
MQPDDSGKDPDLVLSYLLGRRLRAEELLEAFELTKSTYYERLQSGKLITADSLITAARNLGLNPMDLLVRYGLLTSHEVIDAAAEAVSSAEEVAPLMGKSLTTAERRAVTRVAKKLIKTNPEFSPRLDRPPL